MKNKINFVLDVDDDDDDNHDGNDGVSPVDSKALVSQFP